MSFGELVPLDYVAANVDSPVAYHGRAAAGRLVQQRSKLNAPFTAARPAV
jgi:hypothetical protein